MVQNPLISDFKFEHKMIITGTLYLDVQHDGCLVDSHHVHLMLQTLPPFRNALVSESGLSCRHSRKTSSLMHPQQPCKGTLLASDLDMDSSMSFTVPYS